MIRIRYPAPNTQHPTPVFAVAAVALLATIGCHSNAPGPTTIDFWAMGREGEMVQRLVPAFERLHPDVRIRVQQIPWGAAHEKLLTAYVGEAMPDVFQLGNTWIAELAALEALEPLDSWLRRDPEAVRLDDYPAGILDMNRLARRTRALPWYVDTRLLFYRTDLLRDAGYATPPATWTGWREALQRVQQRRGAPRHAILLPLTEWQVPIILALQHGATLLRGDGEYGAFRAPATRAAFDLYLSFFRLGLTPATTQIANLYHDFANGDFACFISGPWSIGELRARTPPAFATRWATAPLPTLDEAGIGVSLAGGASLAMFRGSPRKDAAWQWMVFLSQPQRQVEFFKLTGDLPARTSAWTNEPFTTDPVIRAFGQQLRHAHATPKVPEWERIASKVSQYGEAMVRETLSVDAALAALDADVDVILAKRRWMLQRAARAERDTGA